MLFYRDTLFAAGQVRLCLHFPKLETRGTAVKVLNHLGDEYKGVLCLMMRLLFFRHNFPFS